MAVARVVAVSMPLWRRRGGVGGGGGVRTLYGEAVLSACETAWTGLHAHAGGGASWAVTIVAGTVVLRTALAVPLAVYNAR
jgi:hypothetical protein